MSYLMRVYSRIIIFFLIVGLSVVTYDALSPYFISIELTSLFTQGQLLLILSLSSIAAIVLHYLLGGNVSIMDSVQGASSSAQYTVSYARSMKSADIEKPKTDLLKLKELTGDDIDIIAAHEVGHVFLYGLIDELPDNVTVDICRYNYEPYHGRVSGVETRNLIKTDAYTYWQLLVLYAGRMAERMLCDRATDGCVEDLYKWNFQAHNYLCSGCKGVYFCLPKSDFEHAHNVTMMNALQEEMDEKLYLLFKANKALLTEMQKALIEKDVLNANELKQYFTRANYSDSLPNPGPVKVHNETFNFSVI